MHLNLVIQNPIVTLFTIATAFLSSLPVHFGMLLFSAFDLAVHQLCNAETDTCLKLYNPFHFDKIYTREDANVHMTFACKYFSKKIARLPKNGRQCVLVFANDLGFGGGNCNGLLTNTGLRLSTGNRYRFLLRR